MTSKAPIVLAIGAGYFLGRTHKLRWAVALGTAAATGRLGNVSSDLLKRGTDVLNSSPELARISASGQKLLSVGRAAAITAVSSKVDSMSDALRERVPDADASIEQAKKPLDTVAKKTGRREAPEEPEDEYDEAEDEYDEDDEDDELDDQDDEDEEDEDSGEADNGEQAYSDEDEDEGDEEPPPSSGRRRPEPVVRRTGEKAGRR